MDLNKLTTSDKVIAGSGIALLLFSFFPWFGAPNDFDGFDRSGWDFFFWGIIPTLLGVLAAGSVLASKLGDVSLPALPIPWGQAYLIAGGVAALLVVLKFLIGDEVCGFGECGDLDRKFGLFIAAIAAIGLAAGGFLKFQEGDDTAPPAGGSPGAAPF